TLQGRGPNDLVELTLDLAVKVATASRGQLVRWLEDGTAWRKFVALVEGQGGDGSALEKIGETHAAPIVHPMPAQRSGTVERMNAEAIGRAALYLGAGRAQAADVIDFSVGCSRIKQLGEQVEMDEPLMLVHARSEAGLAAVLPLLEGAVEIS
ncbi:MAG: hypothetical protein ABIR29_07320, partial [Chthoniobacterales bacterium]